MGGEPTRTGKFVYICLAGFLILTLSGCIRFKGKEVVRFQKEDLPQNQLPRDPHSESLSLAKTLLERSDFDGAFREYQKVLTSSGTNPPADEALFHMGIIMAHFGNPKRDYGKSLTYFRRLVKDHPQSSRAEQARLWIGVLQENEKLNQTVLKLQQTLEETKKVDIEIEEKKKEKVK